jgi:hypothetical protein
MTLNDSYKRIGKPLVCGAGNCYPPQSVNEMDEDRQSRALNRRIS